MNQHNRGRTWVIGALLGFLLAAGWLGTDPVQAANGQMSDKLKRQMTLMEKVIDHVLKESPNLLVYSGNPTNGIYLDEFGVLFTFEASLVGEGWGKEFDFSFLRDFHIESDDGKVMIWRDTDEEGDEEGEDEEKIEILVELDDDDDVDGDAIKKKIEKTKKKFQRKRERSLEEQAELYVEGKQELTDALLDYGETLTSLQDEQWVAVVAFLKNHDYFQEKDLSQLTLKVRMRDLRAYAADRLTHEALLERLVEEEY